MIQLQARGDSIPELDVTYTLELHPVAGEKAAVIGGRNRTRITVVANDNPHGRFRFEHPGHLVAIGESKGQPSIEQILDRATPRYDLVR